MKIIESIKAKEQKPYSLGRKIASEQENYEKLLDETQGYFILAVIAGVAEWIWSNKWTLFITVILAVLFAFDLVKAFVQYRTLKKDIKNYESIENAD